MCLHLPTSRKIPFQGQSGAVRVHPLFMRIRGAAANRDLWVSLTHMLPACILLHGPLFCTMFPSGFFPPPPFNLFIFANSLGEIKKYLVSLFPLWTLLLTRLYWNTDNVNIQIMYKCPRIPFFFFTWLHQLLRAILHICPPIHCFFSFKYKEITFSCLFSLSLLLFGFPADPNLFSSSFSPKKSSTWQSRANTVQRRAALTGGTPCCKTLLMLKVSVGSKSAYINAC